MSVTEEELRKRRGPVLKDGTALRDLIDFDRQEVAMRVLNDPEIHRLELKHIFAEQWIGLGHESEIPNPRDFVVRYIGEDPVIVTRADNGEIHGLLNVCAHRGMEICWADQGTSAMFRCPYHGWTYDSTGKLLGAPFQKAMYGDWDKSKYGLRKARLEVRHGLIWGTFSETAPSLAEWMGDARFYYDYVFGLGEWETAGNRTRYLVHANWKVAADQFMGDGYHVMILHQSMLDVGAELLPVVKAANPSPELADEADRVAGHQVDLADVEWGSIEDNFMDARNLVKVSNEQGHAIWCFKSERLTSDKPEDASNMPAFICWFLPATRCSNSGSGGGWRVAPSGESFMVTQLNTLVPRGPDKFEMWAVELVPKGTPEHLKAWQARVAAFDQSMNSDDVTGWPMVQRPLNGVISQEAPLRYFNMKGENKPEGWPGPGTIHGGAGTSAGDDNQWRWWLRWFELLTQDEADN